MADNALTKVARIAAGALQGLTYKDSKGDIHVIKATGDENYGDITGVIGSGTGGGDTGGGDNPDHPSSGADYYAGSLSDGEITGRYLLYQRDESATEDPTTSKTVTLLRDVGTKFNMAGDGATFLLHLQKTAMTAGAKGDVSDIELNYDTNNTAKEGYFTTTSVYPVYIKSADLATTNELDIPIDGIGENLQGGKNFLAPHLKVKFNGDGTMTYYSVTGYDNDGNTAGATGANYDVVVDVIATFSAQAAVAQMPASVNFFSGSASGDLALAGSSNFFENTMDGLEITFDDYLNSPFVETSMKGRFPISDVGLSKTIRLPKEILIDGYSFKLPNIDVGTILNVQGQYIGHTVENWKEYNSRNHFIRFLKKDLSFGSGKVSFNLSVLANNVVDSNINAATYTLNITKITSYKN